MGEEILHRACRDVVEFGTGGLAELVEDMFLTMDVAEGAGLAANQVGVDLRLFVYDCRDETGVRHVGHVCNPVLEPQKVRRLADDREGCLSVPGPYLRLARPDHAVVHGFDIHGSPVTVEGRGYFARCLQHETDHLNGHLYLDRLPEKTRRQALQEMAEKRAAVLARRAARAAEHTATQATTDTTVDPTADQTNTQAASRFGRAASAPGADLESRARTVERTAADAPGADVEGRAGADVERRAREGSVERVVGR